MATKKEDPWEELAKAIADCITKKLKKKQKIKLCDYKKHCSSCERNTSCFRKKGER